MKKKILFICGSINQTSQMHSISMHLPEYDHYFSPYYADGLIERMRRLGLVDFTVLGRKLTRRCMAYLQTHDLKMDYRGELHDYDLVVTCSDLIAPKNIRGKKVILVQEGMTDPEDFAYHLVRALKLPRYLASTSTTGLSNAYDYFCVASDGYADLFARKGIDPAKIRVTGIPNFDNCAEFLNNGFPHHGYVLAATSDSRETFRWENRRRFIRECLDIARGRQLVFKLHPNEDVKRATREIRTWAPGALVYPGGNTDHMIANCNVLVTRYSSVVYVGLALGKEVHSYFDINELRRLTPMQNGGTSARAIASACRLHLADLPIPGSYDELMAASDLFASPYTHGAVTAGRR